MKSSEDQDWIKEVEKEIQKIKEWVCTDRLSMIGKLSYLNGSLAASVTGWNAWFTNPMICAYLSEEKLKELIEIFQRLTLEFLELDVSYTKLVKEKQQEELKKNISKKKSELVRKEKIDYIG